MLSTDFMQQSFSILYFTTNYHTRSCILVEDLSPYNIVRPCPTTLAVAQVLCSHLKSFQGNYFNYSISVPAKMATTCTEDGQKSTTKTSTALQTKRTKKRRTTEEEMDGPTSPGGLRKRQHA
jgi:hypothetical protein